MLSLVANFFPIRDLLCHWYLVSVVSAAALLSGRQESLGGHHRGESRRGQEEVHQVHGRRARGGVSGEESGRHEGEGGCHEREPPGAG